MLKTMIKINLPYNNATADVKEILDELSKVNNKVVHLDGSHHYYDKKDGILYILKDYKDITYSFLQRFTIETGMSMDAIMNGYYKELDLDPNVKAMILKDNCPMSFIAFGGLDFCVEYAGLIPGNDAFPEGYDYANNWDEICDSGIVEVSLRATDQLGRYREVFNEPYLSDTGRDIIGDKICEAPYHGVIPECVDINDVIAELHIDLNAPYMIDTYERDMAQREDRWDDERW